ncbi:MAG: Ni/Fe hydrogenase subunit alpha [Candidatus Micrarchaeota archaeon]
MEKTIRVDRLSKIEGHANLAVTVEGREVKDVKMEVFEAAQFYEAVVRAKPFHEVPITVGRICGFCSQAHHNTALAAIEEAVGLEPTRQTRLLRELLQIGQMLTSHSLHLYFLALPDYLGFDNAIQMASKHPAYVQQALELKHVATELVVAVGAREIHSINALVGGFSSVPTKSKIGVLANKLKQSKQAALETVKLFGSLKTPELESPPRYACLSAEGEYAIMGGIIESSECKTPSEAGKCIVLHKNEYRRYMQEYLKPHSTSKFATFGGATYFVGALARVNNNFSRLSEDARKAALETSTKFPNASPFANNLAQAIELVHFHDRAIEILAGLSKTIKQEPLPHIAPKAGKGIGVTEAPRGTLIHEYEVGADGRVTAANIVTPTAQNLRHMEETIREYVPWLLHLPDEKISLELEKLVRAYDPCFSCSTHFLKLKLDRKQSR